MAKIHKVEMYITDVNDDFETLSEVMDYIANFKYAPYFHVVKGQSAEFEWKDDVIINQHSCTNEQYSDFFNSLAKDNHEQS